ncbi:hypothetical protein BCR34DRAFT_486209 [Clohesyomyces aquaticus]|uniref:Tetratricopeptide repeat-domain-containing protein n=1 Tax=Clohesyomyces aquaticus TaxID=1231657 RepID=A0A1Y1ZJD4_9PLEO|nr:hypothetical protein BCR34DRAFT_486209 [Clohesyomyces aquaticus]
MCYTLHSNGRWKEAEELFAQVMETRKRVLGVEPPDTLISMHNLASTLWARGRWKEAISLMGLCFQLRKRILGDRHPYTKSSLEALSWWQIEEIEIGH